jgi:hypothetical protein
MSISFSSPQYTARNMIALNEVDFINKYGNYASGYKHLNLLGSNKHVLHVFIAILSLFGCIILFVNSPQKVDSNNQPIERTTIEKIFRTSAWVLLIVFVLSIIYGGYLHFFLYLPEYNDWFSKLPTDAKNQINIIHGINTIIGNMR